MLSVYNNNNIVLKCEYQQRIKWWIMEQCYILGLIIVEIVFRSML